MFCTEAAEKEGEQKGEDAVKEGMHVIKAAMEDLAGTTYIHVSCNGLAMLLVLSDLTLVSPRTALTNVYRRYVVCPGAAVQHRNA